MPTAALEKLAPADVVSLRPARNHPRAASTHADPKVVPLHPASGARQPGALEASRGRYVRMFGVDVYDTTLDQAAGWLIQRAQWRLQTTVAFINAHCVNVMCADMPYRSALEGCDRLFADGTGTRIAARVAGIRLTENVNGTDLFPVLCAQAARRGTRIYLLGGKESVSACAARRMIKQFPDLCIVGSASGYFADAEAEAQVIDAINASGAEIVLVGMGVPAQELWIARHRDRLTAPVLVGVGGLFDYYSGRLPRAPKRVRDAGFEWAWRLALEPGRLAKRYLYGNVSFLARLAWLSVVARRDFDQRLARTG